VDGGVMGLEGLDIECVVNNKKARRRVLVERS
jgi:hypothetical protein